MRIRQSWLCGWLRCFIWTLTRSREGTSSAACILTIIGILLTRKKDAGVLLRKKYRIRNL